jgi:uncharacterized protein with GYD domain
VPAIAYAAQQWAVAMVGPGEQRSLWAAVPKEDIMPTYVLLSTLTPEGQQTLHKNPDRLEAVNKEIEDFGCKIVAQYALLGAYDFISIIEAPDNETVAHLSLDLGSRGTVKIMTLPAIPRQQFRDKLKGPKQMGRS